MSDDRPLGLISLDELVRILPDLIADAQRQHDTRVPPPLRGSLTKATGVVVTPGSITAEVQLDEDEPGVLSQVQLANAVDVGDRVVVLLSPGGSAIAIGNGNAQARSGTSGADGSSFDYLEAEDDGSNTGHASGFEFPIEFVAVGANTSGTDIAIDGGNDIYVTADGIYAAEFGIQVTSEAAADTFSVAATRLHVERAVRGDVDLRDDRVPPMSDRHYSENAFAWTGFMHTNDKFGLHASMSGGGADTWACVGYGFVQRIV